VKYVARKVREGINVSDVHPLAEAATLVAGLTALFLAIALLLIFLIEIVLYFVPAEAEARLFTGWMPEDVVVADSANEQRQATQLLLDRLAGHWADAPYKFHVEIDESATANAMALPGGLIVVTQGLLDEVESENELAFVLGHELGHFRNRDHLRALGRGIVISMFFAVITGNDVAGLGIKATDLTLRGFSRKQETTADEFALALVNARYGHVNQASRLFERWDEEGTGSSKLMTYLSTHPHPRDRARRLSEIAYRDGWRSDGEVTPLSWSTQ